MKASIYMTVAQIAELEGKTPARIRQPIAEIREEVAKGRYPKESIGEAPIDINYYVYRDYRTYRARLRNRQARKSVPPFNPAEIAKICPVITRMVSV